MLIFAQNLRKK